MPKTLTIAALLALTTLTIAQQPTEPPPPEPTQPQGQVLFHRSEDQSQDTNKSAAKRTPEKTIASLTDAERSALAFTAWDLDLHIAPATSHLVAHARFTVRNTSAAPLTHITLQLSSTLHWESLSAPFTEHTLLTDADHTGQATEALVTLPRPLAPGATFTLTGLYSGTIPASGERLTRIGAPPEQAVHADWDQISPIFTALRGFGDVLWYPVSSPPLFLGDGAKLFHAIGLSRLQQALSSFRLRLTVEYLGEPPADAFLNGHRQPLAHITEEPDALIPESHGVATADFPAAPLGFRTPSLFIASEATRHSENQLLAVATERPEAIAPYTAASSNVAPLLRDWLGPAPLTPLTILDHTGQPFEDDAFLAIPLTATDARQITPAMVHSLAHAWFRSTLPWLNEGVPQLMSLLYTESTDGRDKALAELRALINPLTLAEPENPTDASASSEGVIPSAAASAPSEGVIPTLSEQSESKGRNPRISPEPPQNSSSSQESSSSSSDTPTPDGTAPPTPLPSTLPPTTAQSGQSLIAAHDELYYRAKAAAVLFMLRSITGDAALKRALQLYRDEVRHAAPSTSENPRDFQRVLEATSHKDLSQTFDDWVYHGRGLADLSIVNVTSRDIPARNGIGVSWLVAAEIHNAGYVAVDVPVTVRSGSLTSTDRVHVPARSSISTRILFEGTPQELQLNDGTIPETTTPIHIQQLKLTPTLK
ncbi:hypothetical protein [Edaphobacter aggregans]|uniref:hypothetical protein n=1 Tax=Edaphobacter aggregans TaxID=570835 RepID=UPI0005588247|nr:hypothetical protein [Edaphobacter aggregans]